MKKLTFSLVACLSLAGPCFAGHRTVSSGKDYKAPQAPMEGCFKDQELQLDIFGAYADGNALDHAGPLQDHGFGGGLGVNYFFTRMVGLGVDATGLYGRESRHNGAIDPKHTTVYNFTGSVILRFPIDSKCLAPYVFAGGGFHTDGDNWASAHGGLGVEYRVVPQKIGIFTDARWTYYGDRYGNGDQNNAMARAGIRLVF
jgi:hypothetical protein